MSPRGLHGAGGQPADRADAPDGRAELGRLRLGVVGVRADSELVAALEARAASVVGAAEDGATRSGDTGRIRTLVAAAAREELDALVVLLPAGAETLVRIAEETGGRDRLLAATRGPVGVAAPDPRTAAALESSGIPVAVMPTSARTTAMIRALDGWAARRVHGMVPAIRDRRWPIELCPDARVARIDTRTVVLGELEFGVLATMVRRPAVTCRHELILREVWGPDAPGDPTRIKHHISRLRDKLGPAEACLETVRGVGYRYVPGRRGH